MQHFPPDLFQDNQLFDSSLLKWNRDNEYLYTDSLDSYYHDDVGVSSGNIRITRPHFEVIAHFCVWLFLIGTQPYSQSNKKGTKTRDCLTMQD